MPRLLVPLFLALAAAAAAAPDPFAYDRAAPLELKELRTETRGGALVRDVTFVGDRAPVTAYLVAPAHAGPAAGILFVHWLGDPATTNRTEFLAEAVALAPRGVVSVLVDAMWSQPGWWDGRREATDVADATRQVIALRRALDLLFAQPGVDPHRVALVGHDFGAMYGAVAGAADGRPCAYVLMAPTPRLTDWYLFNVKPADLAAYQRALAPFDPLGAVGRLAPAPVLFQFAAHDKYVPPPRPEELYAAAAPRKLMGTYDCNHDLSPAVVGADRVAFLVTALRLAP